MLVKEISYNGEPLILVKYVSNKADKFCFYQNLPNGTSAEEIAEQFENNLKYAKRTKTKLKHVILSFHPDSTPHLNDEKLYQLVSEYARLRAPDSMIFCQKHVDQLHLHLHLIISNNKIYQDKSIRLDKVEYIQKMKQLEMYQMEHFKELNASLAYYPLKDKKLTVSPKQTQKQELIVLLSKLAETSRNLEEFYALIDAHPDLENYSYRNRINGTFYKEKKYRFKKHIPMRYSELEQLQRWHELSIGNDNKHELTR